jgi:predicted MPP superfamily phosphohydrolase
MKGMEPFTSRVESWTYWIVLGVATVGIVCMAYGYFVEPYWPEITHVQLETTKLSKGSRSIRIVHISDLHSDPTPRLEESLPDLIVAEKPDLIVFTGDAINSSAALPLFKKCLKRLAGLAPTFVVKGNWDMAFWTRMDLFGDTGARELDGEAARIEIDGVELWVAGAPFGHQGRIEQALAEVPPESFVILLYHSPDEIEMVAKRKVDLYCAGHTHGGQVALPFYGAIITLSRFGKKYEAGLHREGNTWLYVNRGIGMEGRSAPRVRFWSRPEITVVELAGPRN